MKKLYYFFLFLILILICGLIGYFLIKEYLSLQNKLKDEIKQKEKISIKMKDLKKELEKIKNEDQYKKNEELKKQIDAIEKTYDQAVKIYEKIIDLKGKIKDISKYEKSFAEILALLAKRNYSSSESKIKILNNEIQNEISKITSSFKIPENVVEANAPPDVGYQRQKVKTDDGIFMVDIVAANLSDTKVIVDTASDSDCANDCPVLSLADYVARNGAYAGINGSYFCPADYPSCADKKNSFEFLLMNKNKKYFNSEKNVYSNIPAVIFGGDYIRYISRSLEWGRDTSIDGMIANYPLLVLNGEIVFSGSNESKLNIKSNRSFFGSSDSKIYIGVVWNATVMESAKTIKSLGIKNAINLDSGGSTALWYQGYKAGPGRNIPNAILFVRK